MKRIFVYKNQISISKDDTIMDVERIISKIFKLNLTTIINTKKFMLKYFIDGLISFCKNLFEEKLKLIKIYWIIKLEGIC